MSKKIDDALSGYTNERSILEAQEQKTKILAEMAGEEYTPDPIPKSGYTVSKRMRESMQKENEFLEAIAEGSGAGGGANKLAIDYGTDVLSLKKGDEPIANSGVTLPAYGLSYDTSTGGLTMTKNGIAIQGQTVSLPDYGSPLTASSTSDMTDTDRVYVNTTDGKWYYYDGDSWEIGGTYNSQGIDTDTTLLVSGAPADAKATGDAVADLKTRFNTMSDFYDEILSNIALSGTEQNVAINDSGKWTTSNSPKSWIKAIPSGALKCTITANNDNMAFIAFLTSNSWTNGGTPAYCNGTSRIDIPVGTTETFFVPSDATYIYVRKSAGSIGSTAPTYAVWETYTSIPVIAIEEATEFTPDLTANPNKRINSSGNLSDINGFSVSGPIQIPTGTTFVSIIGNIVSNSNIIELAFYSSNVISSDYFLGGVKPSGEDIGAFVPDGATYIAIGSNTNTNAQTIPVDGYYFSKSPILKTVYDTAMATPDIIKTPEQYDLVVGDTFELFYKGVLNTFDPDAYMVLASCSKGANLSRKYTYKPASTGNLSMAFNLYNKNNEIQETRSVTLKVHAVPTNPGSRKTVLCVGDSLTQNGVWVEEFARRMAGSGGTPSAYGLSNIAFIGTCERNGVKYEGYGGWTFEDYNTNGRSAANGRVITCTHDKTEAQDQHSEYKDGANNVWKLETITETKITLVLVSGTASSIPNTGTLTWVSGGQNHSNITYTAVENAPSNPFWSVSDDAVNFQAYVEGLGESSLDYVYVLLGWNNWEITKPATYKAYAKTFIDNVIASYPNAKIVLMGLEVPGRDGLGLNYAPNTDIANYIKMLNYVFNVVDVAYKELASDYANVYYMNTSGQFDTEYNMQTSSYMVNTRNSETVDLISNGIHPATSGYLQIADAVTRHLVGLLDS